MIKRGQVSFLTRPVILVMTVVILLILLSSVWSQQAREKKQERAMDLMTRATEIMNVLVSSEDCLALKTQPAQGAYAYVVSKDKLDQFTVLYSDREPNCARDYQFGYRVKVKTLLGPEKEWEFGASEFSTGAARDGFQKRTLPVGIKFSEKDVRTGRIEIEIYDGVLERLSGFLDHSCVLGKTGIKTRDKSIHTEVPVSFTENQVCLEMGAGKACKELLCPVVAEKLSPGDYMLTTEYSQGRISVEV